MYDPKNATPAPFNPNDLRQTHARATATIVQASSLPKERSCLPFATIMKPIGQVITCRVAPRHIQRRICLGATLQVITWPIGFIIVANGRSEEHTSELQSHL